MPKIRFCRLALILSCTLTAASTFASSDGIFKMPESPTETLHRLDALRIDRAQAEKFAQAWRKTRKPANQSNLPKVDNDVEKFRAQILAATTPDALEKVLNQVPRDYDKYSVSLKYLSAQLYLLAPLRGIVWRMRPILEAGWGLNGNKAVHSQVVTALRILDDALHVNLNTDQWKAAFDYVTVPRSGEEKVTQFTKVSDFQNWVYQSYIPYVQAAIVAVDEIFRSNPDQPLVIDRQIGYGTASFGDGLNRYEGHSQPEIAATLSSLHYALHSMYFYCAYNQDEVVNVAAKVGTMVGIDGYFSSELGFTQKNLKDILSGFQSKGFLSLREGGQAMMSASLDQLQQSVHWALTASEALQGRPASHSLVLNPVFFQYENNEHTRRALNNAEGLVSGQFPISSRLTGEVATFNLPAFYQHPPKNLLDLLPQAFDESAELLPVEGSSVTYRNYLRGRATGWDHAAYQTYVVSATPQSGGTDEDYLVTAVRVAHQTPGASLVLAPLLSFVK